MSDAHKARPHPGLAARAAVAVALAAAITGVVYLKSRPSPGGDAPQAPASGALPRLVDVGADQCIPCKMMAPILEELRAEYEGRLEVVFIDVWKNPAEKERYGVRVIPTQIFYDASGRELFRHVGFLSREDILAKWRELGVPLGAAAGPGAGGAEAGTEVVAPCPTCAPAEGGAAGSGSAPEAGDAPPAGPPPDVLDGP